MLHALECAGNDISRLVIHAEEHCVHGEKQSTPAILWELMFDV